MAFHLEEKIMQAGTQTALGPQKMVWAGRMMSALPVLVLRIDGVATLIKPASVVEATVRLGYLESVIPGLDTLILVWTVVYVVPRTSMLGAILLTGDVGGATATDMRLGDPPFPMVFPSIVGVLS
jgi:DoxX-like family